MLAPGMPPERSDPATTNLPVGSSSFVGRLADLDAIAAQRASWGIFRDRRPELYASLLTADGIVRQ
mgnify:CR=1 FL=1